MNEHLQDLKSGGRPMTKLELANKEIERLNNIIDKALELIYANAYDTERKECIDDLWGNIEELVDILKGSDKE